MSLEEKDVVFQQIIAHVIADRGKEHGTEQRSKKPTEQAKETTKREFKCNNITSTYIFGCRTLLPCKEVP